MSSAMKAALIAAVIMAVSFSAPVILDNYGKSRRAYGTAGLVDSPAVEKVIVSEPRDAYDTWKKRQFRGRIILFISDRWPKMNPDEFDVTPMARPYPLKLYNRVRRIEAENLDARSYLYMTTQTGVARKIISVLSEEGLSEMREAAAKAKHAEIRGDSVFIAYMGFPRIFTTLRDLKSPGETVLLYVGAGYFGKNEPESLLSQLREARISADHVVLCEMKSDASVGDRERKGLERFARLIEATH